MAEANEEQSRLSKLNLIRESGIEPYPEKFNKEKSLKECLDLAEGTKISTAGRVIMFRDVVLFPMMKPKGE